MAARRCRPRTDPLAMSATHGSVRLSQGGTVIDTIGFGAASIAEGTPMAALSNKVVLNG